MSVFSKLADRAPERSGRVWVEWNDDHATLWLDNPTARNAITVRMMTQLEQCVSELVVRDDLRVVLMRGQGRAFCAGGHLGEVKTVWSNPEVARDISFYMQDIMGKFRDAGFISVACIEGPAVGGGAEMALACDHRLAVGPTAALRLVQTSLGVVPGWGGAQWLAETVGHRQALRMLVAEDTVGPDEGQRLGLFDCTAETWKEVEAWLLPIVQRPRIAVRAAKQQLVAIRRGQPQACADIFASVWGGAAHRRALGV